MLRHSPFEFESEREEPNHSSSSFQGINKKTPWRPDLQVVRKYFHDNIALKGIRSADEKTVRHTQCSDCKRFYSDAAADDHSNGYFTGHVSP
jgi:hypothetical protein